MLYDQADQAKIYLI